MPHSCRYCQPVLLLQRESRRKKCTILRSVRTGTVRYSRVSGSKKLTVNKKNGKITIKKGTKKGTYKIKVKVTAAGDANHLALSMKVNAVVRVK